MTTINTAAERLLLIMVLMTLIGLGAGAQTVEVHTENHVLTNNPDDVRRQPFKELFQQDAVEPFSEPTPLPELKGRDEPGWVPPEKRPTPKPTPDNERHTIITDDGLMVSDKLDLTPMRDSEGFNVGTKAKSSPSPTPTPSPSPTRRKRTIILKWDSPTPTPAPSATPKSKLRAKWPWSKEDDDPLGLKHPEPARRDAPLGMGR
jgi:hypothetical protein